MSEVAGSDKRAIRQQASAITSSVLSQEKVILYLRSLDLPEGAEGDGAGDHARALADMIDCVQSARQDLVSYMEFLGVAHDYGWDAARIYHEEPNDASKRIQSAVAKAQKKREAAEKEKKKKKSRRSSSSNSSSKRKRESDGDKSSCSHSHSSSHCCQSQPYQKQFRSTQNLPCIRCGDTAHHWRQCPKPATK